MATNLLCRLLNIKHPIIQGGMVWCSGWKLAAAVCLNGGLGVIGAGSMTPEVLKQHIQKIQKANITNFAVNIPLFNKHAKQHIRLVIKHNVGVVITSAGNPSLFTETLQKENIKVLHVVANERFANKAIQAGVDAIIAEGFEAGGHNGKDELTTMCLIPAIRKITKIPLVAAGGISSGASVLAAICLGADGVQIGSRFAVSMESSAHDYFKKAVFESKMGDTVLTLKELTPVRLLKNKFYEEIFEACSSKATADELRDLLGKGRSKKGIFEGDLVNGELEIGQVASQLHKLETVQEIMLDIQRGFSEAQQRINNIRF